MRVHSLILLCPALLLGGCGKPDVPSADDAMRLPSAAASPAATTESPSPPGTGTFLPYQPGATAITYDPAVVPPGATATVRTSVGSGTVSVHLTVTGLIPNRAYGAHLHTMACTALPDQAGPHYQHSMDPSKPSVDPAYANPENEVWLDFTADAAGRGEADAVHPWPFDAGHPPRSLVLHAQSTRTEPGVAGTAGARVACLTLPGD